MRPDTVAEVKGDQAGEKVPRAQPWKKHWPPQKGTELGVAYGFKEGEKVTIFGN